MRNLSFILTILISLCVGSKFHAQNKDVKIATQLRKDGEIEKSIEKIFQIFSSQIEVSLKDSFRITNALAFNLRSIRDNESALEYAKKAVYLKASLSPTKTPNFLSLVPFFNESGQYDSTIYYLKIQAKKQLNQSSKDDYGLAKTNNNIGFTYYLAGQLDSAEFYYKKVTAMNPIAEGHMDIIGLATGNLGQLYFVKKDYKNALINMKIDAKLTKDRIKESYSNAKLGIAESYFMLKEYSKAEKEISTFFSLEKKNEKLLLRGYKIMADIQNKLKNNSKSAYFLKKYIHLNDSLTLHEKPNKNLVNQLSRNKISLIKKDLSLSENKIELMNNELLLAKIKERSQQFKNRIYIILVGLLLFTVALIFFYFKNRQKKNKAIQNLENDLLESEIQSKKKDLNNLATNLSYKRKFIDEIQSKLKELQQKPETQLQENVSLLIREFTNYKNADKSVEVLQADIDKINLSFFNKLGTKFPLLTENEKELCGLFLLKLSSKDIATIRNVTPNAIKKARQRIRKKLPISETEKITTFLERI
jgi:hypothetical protein